MLCNQLNGGVVVLGFVSLDIIEVRGLQEGEDPALQPSALVCWTVRTNENVLDRELLSHGGQASGVL